MFHGSRDFQICKYRRHRRFNNNNNNNNNHAIIMELGHMSSRSGLSHPEVFSTVFFGSFRLLVCVFIILCNLLRDILFTLPNQCLM
jgi:hypothetical protein